jgi:23S rRNA (uracil1939-C5)-methyltransferase
VSIIVHNEHVENFLTKTKEQPDFVMLDPPRAGLGTPASERLAALGAQEVVYLSCDPSTLARDLAVLTGSRGKTHKNGKDGNPYRIVEMHLFDLFPQTFHIETLVKLRRVS